MTTPEKALELLRNNLLPSYGCTDPITPALAGAIAYREANMGDVISLDVVVSSDVYKGSYNVIIPGTGEKGILYAFALGIVCGDPNRGLMTLENCGDQDVSEAREMLLNSKFQIRVDPSKDKIYVNLSLVTSNGSSKIIFNGRHEQYSYLESNGIKKNIDGQTNRNLIDTSMEYIPESIDDICRLVDNFSISELGFINEGILMNRKAGEVGLTESSGMNVGKHLSQIFVNGGSSTYWSPKILATAVGDARMGGRKQEVMSVFGSGNQGGLIFNTISSFGGLRGVDHHRILKSIALSLLLAGLINKELEEGTPLCKCALVASSVTAAGCAYLLEGTPMQIENAIQMTISSLAGLICDGAKSNCSLKMSLGGGAAIENALLALTSPRPVLAEGILGKSYLASVQNLSKLGKEIKLTVDQCIIDILNTE
jgi:L-cysteine desulfidase